MKTGIPHLIVMMGVIVMTGCSSQEPSGTAAGHDVGSDFRNASYRNGERSALRVRKDETRNRQWVLTLQGVRVYDAATKQLIGEIGLPGWSVARIACDPDMALDKSGSAIISSNAEAKLWRVDGDSYAVSVRDIRLHEREQWDVGFGALAYSADGTLLASTHQGGTLWRVDIEKGGAHIVLANATRACNLALAPGSSMERSR
jgi:hypothetical protein